MSSLPESYRPTLQMITAAERASKLSGVQANAMKADNLIAFIIEEAQHRVINDERTKSAESALAARTKKPGKSKGKKKDKAKPDVSCENCERPGHTKADCYSKGGGKEGQGPRQKKAAKAKEVETAVVAADDNDENKLFAFTCTSDHATIADDLDIPKSKLGTCMDSGASRDFCPDRTKFLNYRTIRRKITMASGSTLDAVGMGDLQIELPNGNKKTKVTFKNAIHAPDMAFTLLSISRLDKAGFAVLFKKGMCTISNPDGKTIGTIPHTDGLYKLVANRSKAQETANSASAKMSISEAHKKLGHIAHSAIRHAITKGLIEGIDLDANSKPDFCEACAKAKSARQPFPKESETRAEKFGDRVHWDLWGPASVRSLNGHHYYVAARIDDATRQTKLYFQDKKSETFESYKKDEAYIYTQSGNRIKISHSDRGGEFLSSQLINHQDMKGMKRELTVHDSPPQNGVSERGMRTRAKQARALLISSGLPRYLWEEAMKHSAWIQDRTPA